MFLNNCPARCNQQHILAPNPNNLFYYDEDIRKFTEVNDHLAWLSDTLERIMITEIPEYPEVGPSYEAARVEALEQDIWKKLDQEAEKIGLAVTFLFSLKIFQPSSGSSIEG